MGNILAVGLGGAAGATARYLFSLIPIKLSFPALGGLRVLTLLTNILGALLIGFIVGISMRKNTNTVWLLFWKTGVCGGFTTFSTFSLEALQLFQNDQSFHGVIYVLLSVLLCILGVAAGQFAALRLMKIF